MSTPVGAPLTRRALRELRAPQGTSRPDADAPTGGITESVITGTFATITGAAAAASDVTGSDSFETASRAFASVSAPAAGEEPAPAPRAEQAAPAAAAPAPQRRTGLAALKRVAATSFSIGVVGVVGLLTVGLTTPAAAVAKPASVSGPVAEASDLSVTPSDELQVYVAPAAAEPAPIERTETYQTASLRQYAADFSIAQTSDLYVNDTSAAIQWPFPVGVPMSSPFGMRDGRMHEGVDFVPGEGSKIQAIADGTVRIATENGDAFGVTVLLDHTIDGQLVSTRYGHMQYGSLQVTPGQQVKVGQVLGSVGNTGRSFGAHLHFEVHIGGTTPVDPIAWLNANAGRSSLG